MKNLVVNLMKKLVHTKSVAASRPTKLKGLADCRVNKACPLLI